MRPRSVRVLAWVSLLVAVALAVGFVVFQTHRPAPERPLTSLSFHQSQAVPNFDDHTVRVDVKADLAELTAIAKKYDVDLAHYSESQNDGCTGGVRTTAALVFSDGGRATLDLYDCGGTRPKGTFLTDATALFTHWRTDGV